VIVAAFSFSAFGISGVFSVVGSKESFFLNFSEIFGKIALSGVVGSERKFITKRVEKLLANVLLAKGGYSWKTGNETCKSLFG
jgi:hypothetical protein